MSQRIIGVVMTSAAIGGLLFATGLAIGADDQSESATRYSTGNYSPSLTVINFREMTIG
jgi:hypothetical protein